MKRLSTIYILLIALFLTESVSSQTIYRSRQTGNWGDFNTWDRSTDNGVTYVPAISGQLPTTNTSVIIINPHVVTLEASGKNCVNLTINNGAQLVSSTTGGVSNAFALRIGAGTAGTGGVVGVLQNDGILGGPGSLIVLELPATATQATFTGTGSYEAGRIRAITGNANYPSSAATGHTSDAKLIIDKDIKLNTANNYCFSMPNSTVASTDTMAFTINAGKTVTITDVAAKWENSLMVSGGAVTGGKYTYNINGTLDLSATTTGTSAFIPYSNASSSITVNINGTVKLGALFKADTVVGSTGGLFLNINNGGLLDASLTTSFNVGKTGTSANTTNGNIFFVTTGTGALKRSVPGDGTKINFPIGTTLGSYTPVSISNANGNAAIYTVNVQNTFTNTPADPTKVVNKQWNIAVTGAPVVSDTLRFSWTTADEASGFSHAGTINIMHWNGAGWDYTPASVTGTGVASDPYIAKGFGFSSFSPFGITSFSIAPLSLISFTGTYDGKKVNLNWASSNEINVNHFEIERSADGLSFTSLGTVTANNFAGTNHYSFVDLNALSGTSYYRLKIVDNDRRFSYSNTIFLNTKLKAGISIYPNPGTRTITISHGQMGEGGSVQIYSIDGKLISTTIIAANGIQTALDVSDLVQGNYEIIIADKSKREGILFVKQ